MVLGNILIGMDWPYRSELLGAGRATALARIEAAGNAVRVGIAGTASAAGAYAIPAGLVALAGVRSLGYRVALRSLYGDRVGHEQQDIRTGHPAVRNPVRSHREAERIV